MKRIGMILCAACVLAFLVFAFGGGRRIADNEVVITPLGSSRHASETAAPVPPSPASSPAAEVPAGEETFVLNTHSHKFHLPDCPGVASMKEENRRSFSGTREEAMELGYLPCGTCKP